MIASPEQVDAFLHLVRDLNDVEVKLLRELVHLIPQIRDGSDTLEIKPLNNSKGWVVHQVRTKLRTKLLS